MTDPPSPPGQVGADANAMSRVCGKAHGAVGIASGDTWLIAVYPRALPVIIVLKTYTRKLQSSIHGVYTNSL